MMTFRKELEIFLNTHSMDNETHIPDFILAYLLADMIDAIAEANKQTLDWHGTDSVCHPKAD